MMEAEELRLENERMRLALRMIHNYALHGSFGRWRHDIAQMAVDGMHRPPVHREEE